MSKFSEDEIRFIEKSSPILHQQSIIPKLELERLKTEFKNGFWNCGIRRIGIHILFHILFIIIYDKYII